MGMLENHWSGQLLYSEEKILELARSMTYNGINPKVERVEWIYSTNCHEADLVFGRGLPHNKT